MEQQRSYQVGSSSTQFPVTVVEKKDLYGNPTTSGYRFGGPFEKPCIVIIVNHPPVAPRLAFLQPAIAHLSHLYYSTECTVNGAMSAGEGTRQMVRTALSHVVEQHPFVQRVRLTDMSTVHCNGSSVPLAPLYMSLYGQTWYEKAFGARPVDDPELHRRIQEQLRAPVRFLVPAVPAKYGDSMLAAASFLAFFRELQTSLGRERYCAEVGPWLPQFFTDLAGGRNYLVGRDWDIDVTLAQRGGGDDDDLLPSGHMQHALGPVEQVIGPSVPIPKTRRRSRRRKTSKYK